MKWQQWPANETLAKVFAEAGLKLKWNYDKLVGKIHSTAKAHRAKSDYNLDSI